MIPNRDLPQHVLSQEQLVKAGEILNKKREEEKSHADFFCVSTKSGIDFIRKTSFRGRIHAVFHLFMRFFGKEGYLLSDVRIQEIVYSINVETQKERSEILKNLGIYLQSILDHIKDRREEKCSEHTIQERSDITAGIDLEEGKKTPGGLIYVNNSDSGPIVGSEVDSNDQSMSDTASDIEIEEEFLHHSKNENEFDGEPHDSFEREKNENGSEVNIQFDQDFSFNNPKFLVSLNKINTIPINPIEERRNITTGIDVEEGKKTPGGPSYSNNCDSNFIVGSDIEGKEELLNHSKNENESDAKYYNGLEREKNENGSEVNIQFDQDFSFNNPKFLVSLNKINTIPINPIEERRNITTGIDVEEGKKTPGGPSYSNNCDSNFIVGSDIEGKEELLNHSKNENESDAKYYNGLEREKNENGSEVNIQFDQDFSFNNPKFLVSLNKINTIPINPIEERRNITAGIDVEEGKKTPGGPSYSNNCDSNFIVGSDIEGKEELLNHSKNENESDAKYYNGLEREKNENGSEVNIQFDQDFSFNNPKFLFSLNKINTIPINPIEERRNITAGIDVEEGKKTPGGPSYSNNCDSNFIVGSDIEGKEELLNHSKNENESDAESHDGLKREKNGDGSEVNIQFDQDFSFNNANTSSFKRPLDANSGLVDRQSGSVSNRALNAVNPVENSTVNNIEVTSQSIVNPKKIQNSYLESFIHLIDRASFAKTLVWKNIVLLLKSAIDLETIELENLQEEVQSAIKRFPQKQCLLIGGWRDHPLIYRIQEQENKLLSFSIFYLIQDVPLANSSLTIEDIPEDLLCNSSFLGILKSLQQVSALSVIGAIRQVYVAPKKEQYPIEPIDFLTHYLLPTLNGQNRKKGDQKSSTALRLRTESSIQRSLEAYLTDCLSRDAYTEYFEEFQLLMLRNERLEFEKRMEYSISQENYQIVHMEHHHFDTYVNDYQDPTPTPELQKELNECRKSLDTIQKRVFELEEHQVKEILQAGYRIFNTYSETPDKYDLPGEFPSILSSKKDVNLKCLLEKSSINFSQEEIESIEYGNAEKAQQCANGRYNSAYFYSPTRNLKFYVDERNHCSWLYLKIDDTSEPIWLKILDLEGSEFKGALKNLYLHCHYNDIRYLCNQKTGQIEFWTESKEEKLEPWSNEESFLLYSSRKKKWSQRRFQTVGTNGSILYLADIREDVKNGFIKQLALFEDPEWTLFLVDSESHLQEIRLPRHNMQLAYREGLWYVQSGDLNGWTISNRQSLPYFTDSIGALILENSQEERRALLSVIDHQDIANSIEAIPSALFQIENTSLLPCNRISHLHLLRLSFERGYRKLIEGVLANIDYPVVGSEFTHDELQILKDIKSKNGQKKSFGWRLEALTRISELIHMHQTTESDSRRNIPWKEFYVAIDIQNTWGLAYHTSRQKGTLPFRLYDLKYDSSKTKDKQSGVARYEGHLLKECENITFAQSGNREFQLIQTLYFMAFFAEDEKVQDVGNKALSLIYRNEPNQKWLLIREKELKIFI